MTEPPSEAMLGEANAAVSTQADAVRSIKASLKEGKVQKSEVDAAILKLKDLKAAATKMQQEYDACTEAVAGTFRSKDEFRAAMVNAAERRMFYVPSYRIYGSVAGFYDYGPPGCAVKQNITALWRQHFVLEESMLEVECPAVTPAAVLKASGHVERFTDLMVRDLVTHDCHRADHLLEGALERALANRTTLALSNERVEEARTLLATVGELKEESLGAALTSWQVKAPDTGNDITPLPFAFNLMFKTSIGPSGASTGYLRPETAQGIFVNFKDLLYFNGGKLPFAAAQIGQSYRNEISPKQGLLRVREFTQAEIEHFCFPDQKDHPGFASVADEAPLIFSRELQMGAEKKPQPKKLGEAVAQGIIANETLGYFIGRTHLFLKRIGLDQKRVRFRQHLEHEMAHYAQDCWDAEIECSYGWVECVGLADRSAFDLDVHSKASTVALMAREDYPEPRQVKSMKPHPNRKELGKTFKQLSKAIEAALAEASEDEKEDWAKVIQDGGSFQLVVNSATVEINKDMVSFKAEEKKETGRWVTPSVIEPSFGIGRILYCLLEHSFYAREGDAQRTVFAFSPAVAPVKATVFPLLQKPEFNQLAHAISKALIAKGLSATIDTTGTTIGKRYSRTDELGVPFSVTVDHQTVLDGSVTVRERDSTAQIRVPSDELPLLLADLSSLTTTWEKVQMIFPAQQPSAAAV